MTAQSVRLKVLLRKRHWQSYRTFCAEYDKVARSVDPRLIGTAPSRAQLHRWLSGELKGLPYGDHCRILEKMFPGWSADQLFQVVPAGEGDVRAYSEPAQLSQLASIGSAMQLVTSGGVLGAALIEVARTARECFVAVGSRSREPRYLDEVERVLEARPSLVHYRILIGPPHNQIFKDHLIRLIEICDSRAGKDGKKTIHIGLLSDLARDHERFFVANEEAAVVSLPSANSPRNFDTALIVADPLYVQGLLQHGKALYGKHRLESRQAVDELEVLE